MLDQTLLIVTADHSNTMTISGYPARAADIAGQSPGTLHLNYERISQQLGAHYLCSTRQWLDEGWIDGGYSPNKVWIYMLFIHSTYVRYPHFTNAYALSTHHLGIPILYLPIICACPPHLGQASIYTGVAKRVLPRFGEFCYCCCLPLLPQLVQSILATWAALFWRPLYSISGE